MTPAIAPFNSRRKYQVHPRTAASGPRRPVEAGREESFRHIGGPEPADVLAWPLAIVYWILRLMAWVVGVIVDWLTLGPVRRRRR